MKSLPATPLQLNPSIRYVDNVSSDKGTVDYLTTLTLNDDTAYKYNKEWRVPTPIQIQELLDNTNQEVIKEENNVYILKLTSKINNNYIYIPYNYSISEMVIMSNSLAEWGSDYEKFEVTLAGAVDYMSGYYLILTSSISYGTFFRWRPYTIRPVKCINVNENYININLNNVFTIEDNILRAAYITYAKLVNSYLTKRPVYDVYTNSFLTNIQKNDDGSVTAFVDMIGNYQNGNTNNLLVQQIIATPDGTIKFVSAPV